MANTDRWEKKPKRTIEDEEDELIRLHDIDMYDQDLQDIKYLVNEMNKRPKETQRPYKLAINKKIEEIYEDMHDVFPTTTIDRDIQEALKGGKVRNLYPKSGYGDESGDIIQIPRKKKISHATSKRKPVKKIVKRVTRKSKPKKK